MQWLASLAGTCGPFLREEEQLPPDPDPDSFLCQICYENLSRVKAYALQGGGGCTHGFCRECVGGWLSVRVAEGEISNSCPMSGCAAEASEVDVAATCEPTTLQTYRRFKTLKGPRGHKMRECPQCTELSEVPKRSARSSMTCIHCAHEFCRDHGDAHQGKSCLVFIWELRGRSAKDDENFVARTSRECPRCKTKTYKTEGCNHLTCRECARAGNDVHWCWLCGIEVPRGADGVTDHFAPGGPCSGGLWRTDELEEARARIPVLYWINRVLILKLLLPPLIVVWLIVAIPVSPALALLVVFPLHILKKRKFGGVGFDARERKELFEDTIFSQLLFLVFLWWPFVALFCWAWMLMSTAVLFLSSPLFALYVSVLWCCSPASSVVSALLTAHEYAPMVVLMPVHVLSSWGPEIRFNEFMGGIVLVVPIVVITVLVEAILLVIVFGAVILFLPVTVHWVYSYARRRVRECMSPPQPPENRVVDWEQHIQWIRDHLEDIQLDDRNAREAEVPPGRPLPGPRPPGGLPILPRPGPGDPLVDNARLQGDPLHNRRVPPHGGIPVVAPPVPVPPPFPPMPPIPPPPAPAMPPAAPAR